MYPEVSNRTEPSRRQFLALAALPFFHKRTAVPVGGVQFRALRNGSSPRRYFHVHGNETTAREILRAHMKTHKGVAWLVENDKRNIPIEGGVIDPNRMFSREGAAKSLRRLNRNWSEDQVSKALATLDRQRPALISELIPPKGGVIIALHNNSEGYSVRDEIAISDKTSIKQENQPHEFFLCTDAGDFAKIAAGPYNVVLQQKAPPDDDGSLSRLAALKAIRYVNLEVGLGKTEVQRAMLEWLETVL